MTSAIPVQRSTNWANKPTGSWSMNWVQLLVVLFDFLALFQQRFRCVVQQIAFKHFTSTSSLLYPDPFSLPFFLPSLFLQLLELVMQLDISILYFSLAIRIIISKVDKYRSNCRLFQHKLWWPFRSLESTIGMVASSSACSHWMFVCLFSGVFSEISYLA